jgi:hypothetical protein
LIEIMGLLTVEEKKYDGVKGFLSAEEVFERIRKHQSATCRAGLLRRKKVRMIKMELKDTAELMGSIDYRDRLRAEYWQLRIRLEKLDRMLKMWDEGKLVEEPTCSKEVYQTQKNAMGTYLETLETRAAVENVDLKMRQTEDDFFQKAYEKMGKNTAMEYLKDNLIQCAYGVIAARSDGYQERTLPIVMEKTRMAMEVAMKGMPACERSKEKMLEKLKQEMRMAGLKI